LQRPQKKKKTGKLLGGQSSRMGGGGPADPFVAQGKEGFYGDKEGGKRSYIEKGSEKESH